MALVLQERGIGRTQWFSWLESVPAFAEMRHDDVVALLDYMLAEGILWCDNGIVSFAPAGESQFGRKNFLELLSVFTSPPLFKVVYGQKELGFVHESTFYKQDDGPAVLVLAGRSWKTNHLDWKRRIAHVESTAERGRSRWLGEGQFLSYRVCQSIRGVLASDAVEECWSKRASDALHEIRSDYPFASLDSTSLARDPNGEIHWWTFAGGIANALLANHLKSRCDVHADNLSIQFRTASSVDQIEEAVRAIDADSVLPVAASEAIDNLKFSEALPPRLAAEVLHARFNDTAAVRSVLAQPRRVVAK
jgi:ATP-dependent Lhr-like helicase